jgi:hypothetical protein
MKIEISRSGSIGKTIAGAQQLNAGRAPQVG